LDLSIILVNWNTLELLRRCLASLQAQSAGESGLATDIWVIDNGSTDGSPDMVRREFPGVHLVCNAANLGFAQANNQGIRGSQSRLVLLLNSDTVVPLGTLVVLVRFMDAHTEAGACGLRLVRPDGSPQPYAFGQDPMPGYLLRRGLMRLLFHRSMHDWATDQVGVTDWVSGACLLLRRDALDQVGLLDEKFFMYYEDNDLCLRLRRAGWKVFYNPQASVVHLGGQSLQHSPRAQHVYQESLRYFYAKHYGPAAQMLLGLGLRAYNALRGT